MRVIDGARPVGPRPAADQPRLNGQPRRRARAADLLRARAQLPAGLPDESAPWGAAQRQLWRLWEQVETLPVRHRAQAWILSVRRAR